MKYFQIAAFCAACLLTACSSAPPTELNPDPPAGPGGNGPVRLVPQIFWIDSREREQIPFRMLDAVNGIRGQNELPPVRLSRELNAAARTHSKDMAVQNRPWHFGSDGSSPVDRVRRVGFEGMFLGENISESYESDLATLSAWMTDPDTRRLILNPDAKVIGIGWNQDESGKIWWTLVAAG